MKTLRYVLGDQLSRNLSSLADIDRKTDIVLMTEVGSESSVVGFHKQKLVLVYSGMRHFARELEDDGIVVDYVRLDARGNTQNLTDELKRAVKRHKPDRIVVTAPSSWRAVELVRSWEQAVGVPVEIREDDRFIVSHARFERWAEGRKSLTMEFFYRELRREFAILMDGTEPEGGAWNYDIENRSALPRNHAAPHRLRFEPDAITAEVITLVAARYGKNIGTLDGFGWAVTRADALEALDHFITVCLPDFGTYQDAMQAGQPFLYHAVLSPYLNLGLLGGMEVIAAAVKAYGKGAAPLNATEGFVRQILGWREYVRGIYWLKMPDYPKSNFLAANRDLPWFYWSGKTAMNCMARSLEDTIAHAYSHHIQRLMVTGNFALLAGIKPAQVEEWYLAVYADAYDWVELPNVHGMALFADGGLLGSKPYAASGAYINRMSNYCTGCRFDVRAKSGPDACPFNLLYWNFLMENREQLAGNNRMRMPYRNLDRMDDKRRAQLQREATAFLDSLSATEDVGPAVTGPAQMGLDL